MTITEEQINAATVVLVNVMRRSRHDHKWCLPPDDGTQQACRYLAKLALEAAERAAWQPIETALEGSTVILATTAYGGSVWVPPTSLTLPATHWRPLPTAPKD